MRRITALGAAACLIVVLPGFAQDETPTFQSGVSLVRVDVDVSEGGRPVMGLTGASFRILDNDREQPIVAVTQESAPLDLILLFDVSGSMKPGISRVSKGAREALAQLRKGDRVSVMIFTRSLSTLLEFTDDLKMVEGVIREDVLGQRFTGGTYLRESIYHAGKAFEYEGKTERRRSVLVITDNLGEQIGSEQERIIDALWKVDATVSGLILQISGAAIQLGPIRVGSKPAPGPRGRYSAGMEGIVEATGGEMLKTASPGEDFRDMIQRLRLRYSLYYTMPDGKPGEVREVFADLAPEVRQSHGKATIRARKGYRMPSRPADSAGAAKPNE